MPFASVFSDARTAAFLALCLVPLWSPGLIAQEPPRTQITFSKSGTARLDLAERLHIGSAGGQHDAFGQIMDATLDSRGRVFVADNSLHAVVVFDSNGKYLTTIGRQGAGPGEFSVAGRLAMDPHDSLFVWDGQLARISVFGPALKFARSIPVSPAWLVTSIAFLPDGRLVLSAFGRGDSFPIRTLGRNGERGAALGPRLNPQDLAGYEASLLGGTIARSRSFLAYSNKSPYAIWILSLDGAVRHVCTGDADWTTPPEKVVEIRNGGQTLHWSRYRHSGRIVAISDSLMLNEIFDPVTDGRTLDLITTDCRLLRRTDLKIPLNVLSVVGSRLLAARTTEFPELVIYDVRVTR